MGSLRIQEDVLDVGRPLVMPSIGQVQGQLLHLALPRTLTPRNPKVAKSGHRGKPYAALGQSMANNESPLSTLSLSTIPQFPIASPSLSGVDYPPH